MGVNIEIERVRLVDFTKAYWRLKNDIEYYAVFDKWRKQTQT